MISAGLTEPARRYQADESAEVKESSFRSRFAVGTFLKPSRFS
jgi:hypothetical protein